MAVKRIMTAKQKAEKAEKDIETFKDTIRAVEQKIADAMANPRPRKAQKDFLKKDGEKVIADLKRCIEQTK